MPREIIAPKQAFYKQDELARDQGVASQYLLSWFWSTYNQLFNFNSGVFWGLIIGFTAIISG